MNKTRISIVRTEGEWEAIEKRIKECGKTDFNSYMRTELSKLEKKFVECPCCITNASGEKEMRQHYVSESTYLQLVKISKIMKKPISTVIDEIIIAPLLLP